MITLDDTAINEFGLILQPGKQHEILSATRDRLVQIPERDGVYDFGADLTERRFSLPLAWGKETSESNLQSKVRDFAAFLVDSDGKPRNIKLSFDMEPDKYYTARYSGSTVPERLLSMAFFTLPMIAFDPNAYASITEYDEEYEYDTGLDYDTGLIYPNPESFEWLYDGQYSTLYNYSSQRTPLILTIDGSVTDLTVTNLTNGESITISGTLSNRMLVIDGKKMIVSKDGVNALNSMSGDFVALESGENQLQFEGTSPNATVTFHWLHKFV